MKIKIFILSIIFIILCLFLSLNQECLAYNSADNDFIIDLPAVNYNVNVYDWLETNQGSIYGSLSVVFAPEVTWQDIKYWAYLYDIENYNYNILFLSNKPIYLNDNALNFNADFIFESGAYSGYLVEYNLNDNSNYGYTVPNCFSWVRNKSFKVYSNSPIYTDNTFTTLANTQDYNYFTYVEDNTTGGSGDGGDSGEDDNIFDIIGNAIKSVFIPNEEQFEDLQENFSDKILSKFNIITISRNGTSYNNEDVYSFIGNNKPFIDIYGYQFEFQYLYDMLHTPLHFGYVREELVEDYVYKVDTGGLTPYGIINLMFGISITILNYVLFNKFFEKE